MTTRQRLIEMAASHLVNNGNMPDMGNTVGALEHIALYTLKGEYQKYYEGANDRALDRLTYATMTRARELKRALGRR
jgi:hypothetical protein